VKIHFVGAARTVTGSLHVIEVNGKRVVLDCGLYQGRREEAHERNKNVSPLASGAAAVVLSHAHTDHSGNLPSLVKKGFRGPIWATPATIDLAKVLMKDSAHIQKQDVEYLNRHLQPPKDPFAPPRKPVPPLYDDKDVDETVKLFRPKNYRETVEVVPGCRVTFYDAGHILGSAVTLIDLEEGGKKVTVGFTGDLGRSGQPIIRDPVRPPWPMDYLLVESTYGDRVHEAIPGLKRKLKAIVSSAFDRGGRVIIPAFSVGRTQNVVHFLNQLFQEGELPRIPIYVDSPLSVDATEAYRTHPECFDEETLRFVDEKGDPFGFKCLTYIKTSDESKALNDKKGPCVVIAASGMCEAGRILHHLKHGVARPENVVLIVGYQAENTLGRRLLEHATTARILGDDIPVRCRVEKINGLSAHADREELSSYVKNIEGLRGCFVVHGEERVALAFAARLKELQVEGVHVPSSGEAVELTPG
jgi:metallo-beta-lactamase family protein